MLRGRRRRAVAAGNVGHAAAGGGLPTPSRTTSSPSSCRASSCTGSAVGRARWPAPCLNVAPDHVDWHGSLDAYAADKGAVYERTQVACVYNVADPAHRAAGARTPTSPRAAGPSASRSACPAVGMLGVVDDVLADRAFVEERQTSAAELAHAGRRCAATSPALAPHKVANALAAAALARAHGVAAGAVRDGLRGFRPDAHRIALVGDRGRRRLRRRLQGHQPARRRRVAGGLRRRRLGRRRPAQGRRRRRPGARATPAGCAASVLLGRDRAQIARRSRDTRRMCPSSTSPARTLASWTTVVRARREPRAARRHRAARARGRLDGPCSATTAHRGDEFAAAVRRHASRRGRGHGDVPPARLEPAVAARRRAPGCGGTCRRSAGWSSPVATYYVLLGATLLLLVLGLVMVLSASSVTSLQAHRLVVHRSSGASWCSRPSACRSWSSRPGCPCRVWRRLGWLALAGRAARGRPWCSPRSAWRSTATATGSTLGGQRLQPSEAHQARARAVGRRRPGAQAAPAAPVGARRRPPAAARGRGGRSVWCWPGTTWAPRWSSCSCSPRCCSPPARRPGCSSAPAP